MKTMNTNPSQCQRVITLLRRGGWHSVTALARASGSTGITRRIWELRQRGWKITNQITRKGLKKFSSYCLES
jgi:hypothetical protein